MNGPLHGLPPEIRDALDEALAELPQHGSRFEHDRWRTVSRVAYFAVAPLIRANERERIAQLAQDVAATYWHQGEDTGGPRRVRPFARLIREEETT